VAASGAVLGLHLADGYLGPAIGKETLPTAFTCRRQSLNFFLFFSAHFFLVPAYIKYNPTSKVGTILSFLAIFR